MTYRSLLLSYFNKDTIPYQGVLLSAVSVEPSHVVILTHYTIQNCSAALKVATIKGHHKVVELLLGAGANPDLQNKVRRGQDPYQRVGRLYVGMALTCNICST